MSQEQLDQVQIQTGEQGESDQQTLTSTPETAETGIPNVVDAAEGTPVSTKRRVKKKGKLVSVEEVLPRPSIWPLLFALALALTFFGFIAHPIIMWSGVVLIVVTAFGWLLERR